MDDNCGEWVECMGVASWCSLQGVGVASGSGWNLWVWLTGGGCGGTVGGIYGCGCKEVYRFPHTCITIPYYSCSYLLFLAAASLLFCSLKIMFFILVLELFLN